LQCLLTFCPSVSGSRGSCLWAGSCTWAIQPESRKACSPFWLSWLSRRRCGGCCGGAIRNHQIRYAKPINLAAIAEVALLSKFLRQPAASLPPGRRPAAQPGHPYCRRGRRPCCGPAYPLYALAAQLLHADGPTPTEDTSPPPLLPMHALAGKQPAGADHTRLLRGGAGTRGAQLPSGGLGRVVAGG